MTTYQELSFDSAGVRCKAWHFPGASDEFGRGAGRAVVVMAHGFAGTKDSGLQPFAEKFQADGLDVIAFDYRGFGASEGSPRQTISILRQVNDYVAAIASARALPGVDPNRIVLWGSSLSGGHVLRAAAGRSDIAAVISMTPLTSSLATASRMASQYGVWTMLRSMASGVRSRIATARGGPAVMMPVVGRPGERAALALAGAYESYRSLAGLTWRNEIDASVGLVMARISTAKYVKALRAPLLVQIADFDRYVPADAVARTAALGRGIVHHYPCDHFDVWPGHGWFDRAASDQVAFLRKVLTRDELPAA